MTDQQCATLCKTLLACTVAVCNALTTLALAVVTGAMLIAGFARGTVGVLMLAALALSFLSTGRTVRRLRLNSSKRR